MVFNFYKNVTKNFNFIKSINNLQELYLCQLSIEQSSLKRLIPLSRVNSKEKSIDKDYFKKDNFIKYLYQTNDGQHLGEISIEVIEKNESISIFAEKLKEDIDQDEFNRVILKLNTWLRNTFLARKINYDFEFQDKEYNKPEDLILTAGPMVSHYENIYSLDAVNNGWNKDWSKHLDSFEEKFSDFIGTKYAIATSSCTGAIYLSLLAGGISEGDEVIVPELTWVATASAIKYTGAKPIFADIDIDTWCIDTGQLENLVTEKTKAIIPVHLYGNPAKMDEIISFAKKHNLIVIEDAAPAIGATFDGTKVGSFGDFGCFSFQGAKLLVTGEGGMVVTDNEDLFNKFKKLWDHGRVPGTFWIDELGYKFKMSNLQAAFGLGQLENIEVLIEAKRRNYSRYFKNLSQTNGIKLSKEGDNTESIHWMTSILLDKEIGLNRDKFSDDLRKLNIDTRPVFPSISQYPIWGEKYRENKNSKIVGENAINLPSGVNLTDNEIDYISESIISLVESV